MLNASYKFASSCIAERLKCYLNKLIHDDQKGFISGRFIGENTRLIYDLMYETKRLQIPGMILLIDFEKAFDTVSWSFIDKVLDIFNFGTSIKNWVHTFYKDSESCVIQNGIMSPFFKLGRGCRQGDPLSPYLFLLCAEILGILIRNNKTLKGIEVFNKEFRLSQYADDTSFFLDGSEKSLKEALGVLNLFFNMSGLKINVEKTKVIWIGAMAGSQIQICKEYKLVWEQESFTVLGIEFNIDLNKIIRINYTKKVEEIKSSLQSWKKRNLTLFGKITILKTLIIPKLNHLFSAIPNPDETMLKELEKLFFKFIWNKGNDKVKRSVIMQEYEDGRLRMINITTFIYSMKISWIRRLLRSNSSWTVLIKNHMKNVSVDAFSVGSKVYEILTRDCNPFWRDVFKAWAEFAKNVINSFDESEILNQPIWFNHHIDVNFKKNWYDNGIRTLYDLVNKNGTLRSFVSLKQIFKITGTFLELHSLYKRLPKNWMKIINEKKVIETTFQPQQPKWIAVLLKHKRGCSQIYKILNLNNAKQQQMKCIVKWNRDLNIELESRVWKCIFLIPYKATVETKLREFQFKILHRIIATKKFLLKINLTDDNKCFFCKTEIEDLLHLFFNCSYVQQLWGSLKQWLGSLHVQVFDWSLKDILLGIIGENPVINHIIIITKYFIYRQSILKKQLSLNNLINNIRFYYRVEKQISKLGNNTKTFFTKWSSFVNVFENPLQITIP